MSDTARKMQTRASEIQREVRGRHAELFESSPIPTTELLTNLGLYNRSSIVAKTLYLDELDRQIVKIPGVIMAFGVWWGANVALLLSLRAVHEPYNWTRKVIGFDTFTGYPPPSAQYCLHELAVE